MKKFLLLTILVTTIASADDQWFQLITPSGEVARNATVHIPDTDNNDSNSYLTDRDGRVRLPENPMVLQNATLEFAGREYSLDVSNAASAQSSQLTRVFVTEK